MPLFFFHLRTDRGLKTDDVGTPFEDLDTAYLDVCRSIPEMVDGLLRDGRDPLRCAFEITDEGGRPVMEVPFAERLTRNAAPRPAESFPAAWAALEDLWALSAATIRESQQVRHQVRQTREEMARLARVRAGRDMVEFTRLLDECGANAADGAYTGPAPTGA